VALDQEVYGQGVLILSNSQLVHSQNGDKVSVRIHQDVLVILRKELEHSLVTVLVNGLNDKTTLLRFDKEASTLVLGNTN
jgi:hypothetical protein